MIVQGPQTGSFEQIYASFYLSYNEWWSTDWGQTKAKHQMRGVGVEMNLDQTYLDAHKTGTLYAGSATGGFKNWVVQQDPTGHVLGRSVWCAGSDGGYSALHMPYIGPIESSFMSGGEQPAVARWIVVQLYGLHDSIYVTNGSTATEELLIASVETGTHRTCSKEMAGGASALTGVVSIDTTIAPTATLVSLTGLPTAHSTWLTQARMDPTTSRFDPTTGATIAGGGQPAGNRAIIGYNIRNTMYTDDYSFKRTKGFLMLLGTNIGRL